MDEIKVEHIIAWGIAIILTWFFFSNGYPKVIGADPVINKFQNWGYSVGFARFIGVLEILGGILVLLPRTAFWAAMLLAGIMVGAVYTHLTTNIGSPRLAIILLILTALLMGLTYKRAYLIGK